MRPAGPAQHSPQSLDSCCSAWRPILACGCPPLAPQTPPLLLPMLKTCTGHRADPALAAELGQPLEQAMAFFGTAHQTYGPLLLGALSKATG